MKSKVTIIYILTEYLKTVLLNWAKLILEYIHAGTPLCKLIIILPRNILICI